MSLLEVDGLGVRYDDTAAVDNLSFAIEAGEAVGLVGESGSGKTQTALAILGLLPASARVTGSVRFDGVDVLAATGRQLDALRAVGISIVFQDPSDALNPYLRIGDQLSEILIAHGLADRASARARVVDMLDAVGLPDPERQSRSYPHQLSGGMRQRAMIASALITEPKLLIADEPTTALDVTVQAQILELLETLRARTALLLITHDLGVVAGHTERTLVLQNGRLVESGATPGVFAAPEADHTRELLAAAPRLAAGGAAATEGPERLRLDAVSVSYGQRGGKLQAVKSVDLTLNAYETVAIVGESGSGKSSLARAVLGLVPASDGEIVFLGAALAADLDRRPRSLRRELSLVFQDPSGSLNPQRRVGDIVDEPLKVHEPGLERATRRTRVAAMLAGVGLDESYASRYPHELSGGEAQRVAIARALILEPKVVVCDEAVAALDGTVRRRVLDVLGRLQQKSGLAMLFISHDLGVVSAISHRVLVMYLGRVVEAAPADALFAAPKHPYTRALIDAVPVPDPAAPVRGAAVAGEVPSMLSPPSGCAFHPRCAYADARCASDPPEGRTVGKSVVRCHYAHSLEL